MKLVYIILLPFWCPLLGQTPFQLLDRIPEVCMYSLFLNLFLVLPSIVCLLLPLWDDNTV